MDHLPKSQLILTGHDDGMIRLWDTRSKEGMFIKMKLGSHKNQVSGITKSPTNEFHFATSSFDGTAKVWDYRSTTPLYTLGSASVFKIFDIDWQKEYIATAGEDSKLHIYMS